MNNYVKDNNPSHSKEPFPKRKVDLYIAIATCNRPELFKKLLQDIYENLDGYSYVIRIGIVSSIIFLMSGFLKIEVKSFIGKR